MPFYLGKQRIPVSVERTAQEPVQRYVMAHVSRYTVGATPCPSNRPVSTRDNFLPQQSCSISVCTDFFRDPAVHVIGHVAYSMSGACMAHGYDVEIVCYGVASPCSDVDTNTCTYQDVDPCKILIVSPCPLGLALHELNIKSKRPYVLEEPVHGTSIRHVLIVPSGNDTPDATTRVEDTSPRISAL